MKRAVLTVVVGLALTLFLVPAFATTLPWGGTIAGPTPLGYNPITGNPGAHGALTLVTTIGGPWSYPSPPDPTPGSGTYEEAVYKQSNGNLVFAFQVHNVGPDIVETLTSAKWSSNVTIDAEQWIGNANGWLKGNSNGKDSSVSFHSGVIKWNMSPALNSNQNSYVLLLFTNAKKYKPGSFTIQDGGTSTNPGLVADTPEPASLSLLGLGLAGLGVFRRKKK